MTKLTQAMVDMTRVWCS